MGGQLELHASLLSGTGPAVLAGCLSEVNIDTLVLVWVAGPED